jgi:hypothetical protein
VGAVPESGPTGVPDCGLDPVSEIDMTEQLLRLALGWAWNELPARYLPDLEAAVAEGLPVPDDDDRARLRALLDLIRAQPGGTTPGALEKELARAKIVATTDRYQLPRGERSRVARGAGYCARRGRRERSAESLPVQRTDHGGPPCDLREAR